MDVEAKRIEGYGKCGKWFWMMQRGWIYNNTQPKIFWKKEEVMKFLVEDDDSSFFKFAFSQCFFVNK